MQHFLRRAKVRSTGGGPAEDDDDGIVIHDHDDEEHAHQQQHKSTIFLSEPREGKQKANAMWPI